jgi:hypothetical protein
VVFPRPMQLLSQQTGQLFSRDRTPKVVDLPREHQRARFKGFDSRTLGSRLFKLSNSFVERRQLQMKPLDFRVVFIRPNSLPDPLRSHDAVPCIRHASVNEFCGNKGKQAGQA